MPIDELLADRLRTLLTGEPGLSEKKMFGGLCFMIDRHMVGGLTNKGDVMLRVHPDNYEAALVKEGAREMDFTGRVLKGMIYLNASVTEDAETLAGWIEEAVAFVKTLPPKK